MGDQPPTAPIALDPWTIVRGLLVDLQKHEQTTELGRHCVDCVLKVMETDSHLKTLLAECIKKGFESKTFAHYLILMVAKSFVEDFNDTMLMACPVVDALWALHAGMPRAYAEFCKILMGVMIDRRPTDKMDETRYRTTRLTLESMFGYTNMCYDTRAKMPMFPRKPLVLDPKSVQAIRPILPKLAIAPPPAMTPAPPQLPPPEPPKRAADPVVQPTTKQPKVDPKPANGVVVRVYLEEDRFFCVDHNGEIPMKSVYEAASLIFKLPLDSFDLYHRKNYLPVNGVFTVPSDVKWVARIRVWKKTSVPFPKPAVVVVDQ